MEVLDHLARVVLEQVRLRRMEQRPVARLVRDTVTMRAMPAPPIPSLATNDIGRPTVRSEHIGMESRLCTALANVHESIVVDKELGKAVIEAAATSSGTIEPDAPIEIRV